MINPMLWLRRRPNPAACTEQNPAAARAFSNGGWGNQYHLKIWNCTGSIIIIIYNNHGSFCLIIVNHCNNHCIIIILVILIIRIIQLVGLPLPCWPVLCREHIRAPTWHILAFGQGPWWAMGPQLAEPGSPPLYDSHVCEYSITLW